MSKHNCTGNAVLPIVIVILLLAAGAAYYFMGGSEELKTNSSDVVEDVVSDIPGTPSLPQPDAAENPVVASEAPAVVEEKVVEEPLEETSSEEVSTVNILEDGTPLPVRAIGNPDAPIVMVEYASLSCSHCAMFHAGNFQKIKEKYVDTGKVYFVFREFPLNAAALDASKLLRCMPEEIYFSFMALLFDTQKDWAYGNDYLNKLKQSAKLAGLGEEQIETCLADTDIEEKFAQTVQIGSEKHGVRSTPSFVVNGGERLISGNQSFSFFEKVFEDILAAEGE